MDAAFALVDRVVAEVWPVEEADVVRARSLARRYPGLEVRDLVHLAFHEEIPVIEGMSSSRHPSIFHTAIPPACFPTSADATRDPDSISITSTVPRSPPTPSTVTIA